MQIMKRETPESPRALVLIPGHLHYFYNLCGRRVAEASGELGIKVDLATLSTLAYHSNPYHLCILSNLSEVLASSNAGPKKLQSVRQRCRALATCSLDCVETSRYKTLRTHCVAHEVDSIIDLGLCDQSASLP